jgi:hypothetical protein
MAEEIRSHEDRGNTGRLAPLRAAFSSACDN